MFWLVLIGWLLFFIGLTLGLIWFLLRRFDNERKPVDPGEPKDRRRSKFGTWKRK